MIGMGIGRVVMVMSVPACLTLPPFQPLTERFACNAVSSARVLFLVTAVPCPMAGSVTMAVSVAMTVAVAIAVHAAL